jgi:transposase
MNKNYFNGYKINAPQRHQIEFKFTCLEDLVPENHPARSIWEFVQEMDTTRCYDDIKTFIGKQGRSTTSPEVLLTLWMYSLMQGNGSGRKLSELCKNHNVYKWIAGGAPINRDMLNDFRSHDPFKFEDLLVSCLSVMLKHEVISDEDFAQDGTKVKANAGLNSFRKEKSLKQLETELRAYIKQLLKEVDSSENFYDKRQKENKLRHTVEKQKRVKSALEALRRAQEEKIHNKEKNRKKYTEAEIENVKASTTDSDARKMKMGDQGFRLAYNVQFATGMDSRVIYGVDVVNTSDPGTSPQMIGKVTSLLRKLNMRIIKYWFADSAYSSKDDVETVQELFPEIVYFAPPKVHKKVNPRKHLKKDSLAVKAWRDLIDDVVVKEKYKKRCSTAEFSNAQTKNHGFIKFMVRGLAKVKGSAIMQAIAFNIQRFFNLKKAKNSLDAVTV